MLSLLPLFINKYLHTVGADEKESLSIRCIRITGYINFGGLQHCRGR
jgi:hypothetical protein